MHLDLRYPTNMHHTTRRVSVNRRPITLKKLIVITLLAVTTLAEYNAQAQSQEKVYSTLILSFLKGVQWPATASNENFIVGVLEYPPLAAELNTTSASTKIGSKTIKVKEFTNADEVGGCHILFIPAYKAKLLSTVLAKIGSGPTLIITNKIDMTKKGSNVNFVLVDGKLRYEMNTASIEKRGMKISANLKGMGILVQ